MKSRRFRCALVLTRIVCGLIASAHLAAAPASSVSYDPLAVATSSATLETLELTFRDIQRERDLPVRIYLPAQKTPAPVVLFSHGLGGSRSGATFLGKHWAARGYVAVFLQHPGSDDAIWRDVPAADRANALADAASLRNFVARVSDVHAALDQLSRWNDEIGHPLTGRIDMNRVGMSGHSFGAVTTQAVSGQAFASKTSITDSRIKAAVIFSPSKPSIGDPQTAFGAVKIPWLLMTGTNDVARIGARTIGTPDVASRLAVFPALPVGDKFELVLYGADHMVFTDRDESMTNGRARNPNHHKVILALSTAFWDAFLRNDALAKAWLVGDEPRALLDKKDRWQRK
jgi:predicted dienelactone hydrolase